MPYNLRIPGQFTERELWAIEALAKLVPPGGVVVEVGSFLGMSSYAWAKSVDPSVTVYCIDAWEKDAEYSQKWLETYQTDYSLEIFRSFTQKCPNIVVLQGFSPQDFAEWDKSIDVCCQNIDNQNTFEENISFWSQFVKPDGIICGLGYTEDFPNVMEGVGKLAQSYQVEPVIVERIWCLNTGGNANKLKSVDKVREIHGYQYELNISQTPALLEPGDLLKVSGELKNISGRDWDVFVGDTEVVKIGIQVQEENQPQRQEFRCSIGVKKLIDGASVNFKFVLDTKNVKQGKVKLVFDLVAEGCYWFQEREANAESLTIRVFPRNTSNLIKIANQLIREGKLTEAIAEYRRAIELNPHFSWSYYNLGDALARLGHIDEAVYEYCRAIELNPKSFSFYYKLAEALDCQEQFDLAVKYYRSARQLAESSQDARYFKYNNLIQNCYYKLSGQSSYLSPEFTSLIDSNRINYILELGSRDGKDAIFLHEHYQCRVDAFECNSDSIDICLDNLREYPNINLVTKAVWDRNETISFYVSTNGNIGASSCFEETGDYPFEKYNPRKTSVEAIRLDSYLTESPDLICMDLQGAELGALKGLGTYLNQVKYIISELELKPLYKNQPLYDDVVGFLEENGFELQKYVAVNNVAKDWFGDALFVNKGLVTTTNTVTVNNPIGRLELTIDLQKYERKVFCQNGEDGVIEKIFDVIGTTNKYYVEFGVENATECNTRYLKENYGWSGLLMDGNYENKEKGLYQEFVTAENVNALFEKYKVPEEFDLLSIDIDFNDFYVWRSLDEIYKPRVVIIEYNASHPSTEDRVVKYSPNEVWDQTNYFGASIRSLYNLGKHKGYSLIYAENKGVNLFFVRNSILKKVWQSFKNQNNVFLIYKPPKYGEEADGGHKHDDENRKYITSKEILSNFAFKKLD